MAEKMGELTMGDSDTRSIDEILKTIVSKHPIELEERVGQLHKPLLIECACPGWQPRQWPKPDAYPVKLPVNYVEGGVRYPAVPWKFEDQVNEVVAAIKAGCQIAHIHPRDPKTGLGTHYLGLQIEMYDRIFEQVDCLNIQHTWEITADGGVDYVRIARELLARSGGSNRYCQGAVVLWPTQDSYTPGYTRAVQEAIQLMQECKIKPVHKIRGGYHARRLKRDLVDTGVLTEKPYVLVHDMGHPFGWPLDIEPWWVMDMVASLEQTKDRFPDDSIIGVFSGGRNWLPITMHAILMGVDLVRVGIEDCYWMYPHRDDVIQSNMQCVQVIVDFCKMIGRPIATVDQARQIMGMVRT